MRDETYRLDAPFARWHHIAGEFAMIKRWLMLALVGIPILAVAQDEGLPSVVVATVVTRDITPSFSYVGRVEAVDKVELRARVEGTLQAREFREGAIVTEGALLFVIEKAPYQIAVDERKADHAGARASLENASIDLKRKLELRKKNAIPAADVDTAKMNESTAKATVLQAQAALKRAELDLSYTEILSPITGQISRASVSVGNLVGPNSDPLATVTRMDPVYVTIAVSEKDLIEARRQGIDLDKPLVAPFLTLGDGSKYEHDGFFDYLDTAVNQSTDTILARAVFPNPNKLLVVGQFVRVVVKAKLSEAALVVPQASVQEDQQGFFVLVIDKESRVEVRRVRMGEQVGTEWVVTEGLADGERVIVQGIQKVRPDMLVNTVEAS